MKNLYIDIPSLGRRFVIYEKVPPKRYLVIFCGEFCGTFALVFIGCMADAVFSTHIEVTLAFGFSVLVSVECFAHLSGSHINPPVSLASFLLGYLSLVDVPIYIICQLLGGYVGHCMMLVLISDEIKDYYREKRKVGACTPIKHKSLEDWQVCVSEFTLTLVLILVCGAVWDWRNKKRHDSVSIKFGFVIGVLATAGGSISGANMNPARTFGPCLNNGDFLSYHWAYWVGPMLAGVVGALFYRLVFAIPEPGVDIPFDPVDGSIK